MRVPMLLTSCRFDRACLAAGLVMALFVSASALAQDVKLGYRPIKVMLQEEPIHHYPPYFRAYIASGTVKLAFLVPAGFIAVTNTDQNGLQMTSQQGGSMGFSILEPIQASNDGPNVEACRKRILAMFPNAKFTLEFSRGVGPTAGRGFDFTWKTPSGFDQASRVIFLPSDAGTLEFRASTIPEKFTSIQSSLNTVIGTLSIGTENNLKVPQLSDAI